MPIWIWAVLAGIIVSAVMAVKTARQDRQVEDQFIEQEGRKYIERMKEEKERKKNDMQEGAL